MFKFNNNLDGEVRSTLEENKGFGLIVRLEPFYSVIWSSYNYFICISKDNSARNVIFFG